MSTFATVTNVYLVLYPRPDVAKALQGNDALVRKVWRRLNEIAPETLIGEGRVYGGGLHKLEPKELANVPADSIAEVLPRTALPTKKASLFDEDIATLAMGKGTPRS